MSPTKAIAHNQGLFSSTLIALAILAIALGCHLTNAQKKDIIATAAISAEAVVEGSPLPWSQIGIALGALFGSGTMIDNRRKDTLINRLKTENANHLKLLTDLVTRPAPNPTEIPSIRPN